jgi:hypothetical protein
LIGGAGDGGGGESEVRKVFLFEKKKQKTVTF